MNRLFESALSLALFTGFLYALSIANHNAFLFAVGVEEAFITRSSHQVLYNALFVILIPILKAIFWAFLAFAVVLVVIVGVDVFVRASYARKRKLVKAKKFIAKFSLLSKSEAAFLNSFKKFLIFAGSCTFFFAALLYAENQGKSSAQKFHENVAKGEIAKYRQITFQGYDSPVIVISCGINNCAGLDSETKKVIYFENKFPLNSAENNLNTELWIE